MHVQPLTPPVPETWHDTDTVEPDGGQLVVGLFYDTDGTERGTYFVRLSGRWHRVTGILTDETGILEIDTVAADPPHAWGTAPRGH